MEDRCLICGSMVPEGTEVCPICIHKWLPDKDEYDTQKLRQVIKAKKQRGKRSDEQFDTR